MLLLISSARALSRLWARSDGGVDGLAGTARIVPCPPSTGGWEQGIGGGENGGAAEEFANEVEPAPAKEVEVELGKEVEGGGKVEVEGEKEVEEGAGKLEPWKLLLLPTKEAAA